uniref:Protein kinase domain-containing protein n=1 Tax=Panagrolaimus superbus TaxID=310955 RepID=A0A914YCH5_9BILA
MQNLKSDIWAFGIVLYEMYSLGEIPFAKIEPKMLLDYLEAGNRPEKPEFCNQETYDIMLNCWQESPPKRPSFEELLTIFTVFLERSTEGYGYLPLLKSETTPNTNEISQKLAQNIVPAPEPPIPRKTVRQRLTSEKNKIFKKLKRTNTKNSVFQIEDEDEENDDDEENAGGKPVTKQLKIQIPTALTDGPYSAGVEQFRPRFTSVRSAASYGSLNDIDEIIDPGVEMRNGKPRLRSNLADIPSSTNSSLRKSSTFHLGDIPKDGDLKKPFFQRFL